MARLDKTFPTNDCSMCILSPKLVDCGRHENIEIITNTDVRGIEGEPGRLTVKAVKKPRYVDIEACTSCGDCEKVCPISLPSEFDSGLSQRKAIYKYYPQAIPNAYLIDKEGEGEHRGCVNCGQCTKACKADAIRHDEEPEERELKVGAVIIATGSRPFDPAIKPEFGYKRFPNVITSLEFERILSPSGPFEGKVVRPADRKEPGRIAWVQCVGSRDSSIGNEFCSAMCCMYTAKEAIIAREHDPHIQPTIFYIDVRSYGKDFDKYIDQAKAEHGIRYVRSRISEIVEDAETKDLIIRYEDDTGELREENFELVVLSVGLCATAARRSFVENMGLEMNESGFVQPGSDDPVVAPKPGVFMAGAFSEPKAIPESVMEASAAAARAAAVLSDVRGTLVLEKTYPAEKDVTGVAPRIGVFVCNCGINIGGYLDVPGISEFARSLDNVAYVEENIYTCSQDTQKKIAEAITEHGLNRIIVAACTPRTHEPVFQKSMKEAGLNPYLFEMANIREQCSWVHMNVQGLATEKAKELISMTVAKARLLQPLTEIEVGVTQKALVIGGGIAGMSATLSLADQGFETVLVEKEDELGGKLNIIKHTVDGLDIENLLKETKEKIRDHELITVYTSSTVKDIQGFVGNYQTVIETPDGDREFDHGVVIVAVGTVEHEPASYHYGEDERVSTQRELEERLSSCTPDDIKDGETYVMVQCVESRDDERPYCSRVCCMMALKNAIKLKELNPRCEVFILYRDMMTYGFKEKYYTEAREKGVMFLQYDRDKQPELEVMDDGLVVKIYEPMLQEVLELPAHHLVLSTGLVPNQDNGAIARMLKVPLNADGFFLEAHVKLRPVDFATEGAFVAGACHSPKFISESISQACAAAARAATVLSSTRYRTEAIIAMVDEELCSGCGLCVVACPFKAMELVDGVARVNETVCKGCGLCSATCRSGAVQQRGFSDHQLLAMILNAMPNES